ncbi:MAG: hypothetical protein AAF721_31290, partial [Myxococcota bacterium]
VVQADGAERTMLGMLDDVELSSPRFISERYIVARADPRGMGTGGLVLLDVDTPMLALALPATLFGGATSVDEVAVGGTPEAPAFAVTAGDDLRRLYAWTPGPLHELFEAPPVDETLAAETPEAVRNEREGLPTVVLLDTNSFASTVITEVGAPRNVVVSPDGLRVAFRGAGDGLDSVAPGDAEIAIAYMAPPEGGGGVKVVTLNALKDHSPRFTADSKHLVFRTRFDVPRTKWVITAGRIAPVTP